MIAAWRRAWTVSGGDATLTGLGRDIGAFTQGSSRLATLGLMMQSLWDCLLLSPQRSKPRTPPSNGGEGVLARASRRLRLLESALARQRLRRRFQARQVLDVEDLHRLIDALHETAQGPARPELNETREPLRDQVSHRLLPAHRGGHLLDQPRANGVGAAVRLRRHICD